MFNLCQKLNNFHFNYKKQLPIKLNMNMSTSQKDKIKCQCPTQKTLHKVTSYFSDVLSCSLNTRIEKHECLLRVTVAQDNTPPFNRLWTAWINILDITGRRWNVNIEGTAKNAASKHSVQTSVKYVGWLSCGFGWNFGGKVKLVQLIWSRCIS